MARYDQTNPFSPDDGPAASPVVRDLASDGQYRAGLSHRTRRPLDLLRLETAFPSRRLCRARSVCLARSQTHPRRRRADRGPGAGPASPASDLGQTAPRRRTGQGQRLGATRQPQHRQTHSPICRLVAHPVHWPKRGLTLPVRTADQPGQTLNADLCFVPAVLLTPCRLPAVSGSSGRLVVAARPTEPPPAHPGQVFAEPELAYHEAMQAFVATSPPRTPRLSPSSAAIAPEPAALQRDLRQEADRLRVERRAVRQQRQAEDALWRHLWHQQHPSKPAELTLAPPVSPVPPKVWHTIQLHRRATLRQRATQDDAWRATRQRLRAQVTPATAHRGWI